MTHRISDYLIRLKNAAMANLDIVEVSTSKLIEASSKVLKEEGYLDSFETKDGILTARLKKHSKKPILRDLKIVSKPGLRIYRDTDELSKVKGKSSWFLVSTSKGVISSKQAIKNNVGGEVLAEIY